MPWKKREPAIDLELMDRQQEVLTLIAKGRTNPEIAAELGITLDGAKWHVREILSKLGVESREEAAAYWRAHRRPGHRLARTLGTFGSLGLAKGVAVGLAVAAIALLGVTALQSLQSGDPAPASPATATPAPEPTPTSTGPTATTAPPPSISAEEVELLPGMFLEPGPTPVADIELPVPPEPTPTFQWDGESTMIYGRETGELINLGPGEPARFSPDGAWAVWVSVNRFEGDIHAINLRTRERRDLGDGGYVSHFVDDDRFYLDVESTRYAVSVSTGERELVPPGSLPMPPLDATPGGYRLESNSLDVPHQTRFTVTDGAGALVARFDAYAAHFATSTELAVRTIPFNGSTHLFLVDLGTLATTYVASIPFDVQHGQFSATSTHVVWNPDVCADPGETYILERESGSLGRMNRGLLPWVYASPPGLIAEGMTGLQRLLDLETNRYVFVSPAGWPYWSDDFRYVSVGWVAGHGSFCVDG